ncbi:MAG: hypothetical protein BalsKO_21990 [Balneolaceae bacterium]
MVDTNATAETKALLQNLHNIAGEHSLFGHQATLAYGYTWRGDSSRSDVKDVTGSFPALYGWDVADFLPNPKAENQDWNKQRWDQNLAMLKRFETAGSNYLCLAYEKSCYL